VQSGENELYRVWGAAVAAALAFVVETCKYDEKRAWLLWHL